MPWIESHQELSRHPKTKRLAQALDASVPATIGHLHLLWWWALDFAQDGGLDGFAASEIAEAALWEGDPIPFLAALVDTGFIDGDESDHYRLHDWNDYAGKLIERRQRNATRMRETRAAKALPAHDLRALHVQTPVHARAGLPARACPPDSGLRTPESLPNGSDAADAVAPPPRTRPDLRKPKDKEKGQVQQHPLFPVIDEFFGPIIPSRWSAIAKNLHDLDALGATPDDLRYRATAYPAVMGIDPNGKPFAWTLPALINNWQRCAPPAVNGRARAPTEPPPRSKAETAELRRRILAGEEIE